jgi:hypothetical protein
LKGSLPHNGLIRKMDLYTFLLFLGVAGLVTMALQGIGHGHGDASHGNGHHAGDSHAGHSTDAGSHGASHAGTHGSSHASSHASQHAVSHDSAIGRALWSFASPRSLFSISLGAGAVGPLLRGVMGNGVLLFIAALGAGIIFERVIITPIWNFAFRFASKPALMLESCVEDEGTAVTSFDKDGHGIIAVDLDGQVVQLLATLQSDDRALGAAVRAGDRVRIADVDSARNRCTVSVL